MPGTRLGVDRVGAGVRVVQQPPYHRFHRSGVAPSHVRLVGARGFVQIFNDAYRPSFGTSGRDVAALGARGHEHWADIWETIGPQIQQVLTTGEATWHEDHLVPIERNGRMDDVWWTYGYSPLRDDDGSIAGVLVVVQETTARVLMLAERNVASAAAERARPTSSDLFRQAPAFIAVVRGPDFVFELVNDGYYRLIGHREVIGRPLFEALPEVRGQGFEELSETFSIPARLSSVASCPYTSRATGVRHRNDAT